MTSPGASYERHEEWRLFECTHRPELIDRLYDVHGTDFVDRLEGSFAFAVVDGEAPPADRSSPPWTAAARFHS